MKITWTAGIALASALALGACNSGGTATNNTASAAPANTAAPAGNAAAPAGNAAGGEAGATAGARQDFTIVNNTGQAVLTLNVSPTNETQWGPDILGRDILANGESAQIQFERGDAQCNWDIRVTYQDGETGDFRNNNLCEIATVTLTAQ
jgi:hypothetical protein